jgi:hypothetical protein
MDGERDGRYWFFGYVDDKAECVGFTGPNVEGESVGRADMEVGISSCDCYELNLMMKPMRIGV